MKKVIGIKENRGTFNEKPYCNYYIYLQIENNVNDCGICVEHVKVKEDVLNAILKNRGLTDKSEFVGMNVENVYYDSYKNVVDLVG